MDAYAAILSAHSLLRWVFLILAVVVLVRSVGGWRGGREASASDDPLHMAFVTTLDLQVLLGLGLYFGLSPVTQTFFNDPATSMGIAGIRFFAVEHATLMVIALIVAHVGRVLVKKAEPGPGRYRVMALNTGIVILIVVAAIPWPFVPAARPLFRM